MTVPPYYGLRLFTIFFFPVFIFLNASSQPPIQWQKCYGGTNDDNARSIRQTNDGGYVTVGSTLSDNGDVPFNNGFVDYWIVKTDKDGNIQWQKALGGSKSDVAYSVEQTVDGGYIVTGYAESGDGMVSGNHGYTDFWIVRLDANGNLQWQKSFGGSYHDNAHSVIQSNDGSFIIAGGNSSTDGNVTGNHGSFDGWLIKLGANGNLLWQKSYGGSGVDDLDDVKQTPDGGYIVTGYTISSNGNFSGNHGGGDLWVIKVDAQGNVQWQKILGGSDVDAGKKILVTSDGSYIIAGLTKSTNGDVNGAHGDFDYWVIKLDGSGNLQWQKCYGGTGQDMAVSVFPTDDNCFMIGGQAASSNGDVIGNHGNLDYWLVKININGAVQWQKCYGGSSNDMLAELVPTSDGWFIATGSTNSQNGDVKGLHGLSHDFWVVKFGTDPKCTPTLKISVSQNNICMGTQVRFSAMVTNEGTNNVYKWKHNNIIASTNSSGYSPSSLRNGDVIICEYSCKTSCGRDTTIISNSILMEVINDIEPLVTIAATETTVCEGTNITFTATPFYGNMTPSYQWRVNGSNVGTNDLVYSSATLPDKAQVLCILTISTPACQGSTKDYSNVIPIQVNSIMDPSVIITASTTQICKGNPVSFTAIDNGGTNTSYKWKLNGLPAGSNNKIYNAPNLVNRDKVSCTIEIDPALKCTNGYTANSNEIMISVSETAAPSLSIASPSSDICAGDNLTFTAFPENAGSSNVFQWQLNGGSVGNNTPVYSNDKLINGDKVSCILMTNNMQCPVYTTFVSNEVLVSVRDIPQITFTPSEVTVMTGLQAQINALLTGDIVAFEWIPSASLVNPQSLTPVTIPLNSNTTFTLKVVATNGCEADKAIIINVSKQFYMPSAFTPNNDGVNDVFRIPPGVDLQLKEFSIFDRWGNKVFRTTDISKGWDGMFKGKILDGGSFVYSIKGANSEGEVYFKGSVILIH